MNHLNAASGQFRNGNKSLGLENFRYVPSTHQNKVYEQLWIDKNSPKGNPEFGRQAFHDTTGLYSTVQEKAKAIEGYIASVNDIRLGIEMRQNVNGYNRVDRDVKVSGYDKGYGYYDKPDREPIGTNPPPKDPDFSDCSPIPDCGPHATTIGVVAVGVLGVGLIALQVLAILKK
jgi:hypothetical protein